MPRGLRRKPRAKAAWVAPLRARVTGALAVEERASRGYDALTRDTLQAADRHARLADVTGVERVIRRALSEDDRLGQRRPQEMASLLAMLDGKLDAARRLRLARDSWAARAEEWRRYQRAIAEPLALMRALARRRSIRSAAWRDRRAPGSRGWPRAPRAPLTLVAAVAAPAGSGGGARPAEERDPAGVTRGGVAPARGDVGQHAASAWEASAAAAGALMLFDRASEELKTLQSAAEGAPLNVITPRTTRLIRAADLRAFHRAIVDVSARRSCGGARLRRDRAVAQRGGGAAADDRESVAASA